MKKITPVLTTIILFTQTALASFTDANSDTSYKTAIDWMAQNGVIKGYQDNTFKPDKCVNRVELLKMLFITLEVDINAATAELFPDTYANQWYAPYVRTARERGTVQGYTDGTFKPAQCVNRVEAIKMAVLEFNNGSVPLKAASNKTYPSDADPNQWYWEYLHYSVTANLLGMEHTVLGGDGYGYFPSESMSRKEVAEMLYRMKTVKDNPTDEFLDPSLKDFYESAGINYKPYVPKPLSEDYLPPEPTEVVEKTVAMEPGLSEPQYLDYSDNVYNQLLGSDPFVLYFHADWCAVCLERDYQITSNLSDFPQGTKILVADFDTETDLRKKYGITYQAYFVVIDKNGEVVEKIYDPENENLIELINQTL